VEEEGASQKIHLCRDTHIQSIEDYQVGRKVNDWKMVKLIVNFTLFPRALRITKQVFIDFLDTYSRLLFQPLRSTDGVFQTAGNARLARFSH
jgi:hypothetical protein